MNADRPHFSLLAALALAAACTAPAVAQCVDDTFQFRVDFHVTATADLDEHVFWDPEPEMFLEILQEGALICTRDEGDGWQFDGTCFFSVAPPYDPFQLTFQLWDSDEPLNDYTVDIHPGTPAKTLTVKVNPRCGTVGAADPAVIPGCGPDTRQPECRGQFRVDGQEAWIRFEIRPDDGVRPLEQQSLDLRNLELIQIVPNPHEFGADRPTMVRLDAGSSWSTPKDALIRVDVEDTAGRHFVHEQRVVIPACGVVQDIEFYLAGWDGGTAGGFVPGVGASGEFRVLAQIDPLGEHDCPQGCGGPTDCRLLDCGSRTTGQASRKPCVLRFTIRSARVSASPACAVALGKSAATWWSNLGTQGAPW